MTEREFAVQAIEESRATHVAWRDYLVQHPDSPDAAIAGDAEHHRACIAKYDRVLTVLRQGRA